MSELRFLIDENLPMSLVNLLRELGCGAERPGDVGLRGADDEAIAEYAARHGLILVTLDKDFGWLYRRLYAGRLTVVLLRADPPTPERIVKIMSRLIETVDLSEFRGRLVVASERKVRII